MPKKPKKKNKDEDGKPVVKEESGSGKPQEGAAEKEAAQTGETQSEGQQPALDPNQPETGSTPSHETGSEDKIPQASGTGSGDELPSTSDGDKDKPDAQKAEGTAGTVKPSAPVAPAKGKSELSDEEIGRIVAKINSTLAKTAEKGALEIGILLLDKVFGGKLENALSHSPKKSESFNRIAKHRDIAIDATTLARWVKASDLFREFEKNGKKFDHLSCSHFIALLKVRNDKEKVAGLATGANEQKLSVRALKRKIDALRPSSGVAGMLTKNLGNPGALIKDTQFSLLIANKQALSELKDAEVTDILGRVEEKREMIQEYASVLNDLDAVLKEIRNERLKEEAA